MGTLINETTTTQKDMILRFMQENGSITQLQAAEEFGCWRLSARIWDLRADGHIIKTTKVTKKNRYGKVITFAQYSLCDEEAA